MPENGRILIDDLEGTPYAAPPAGAPAFVPGQPVTSEREDWLKRYNIPPAAPAAQAEDEDPLSARYVRFDVDETPGSILHYWFAYSADRPATLGDRMSLWFGGGFELDRVIAHRFTSIVAKLASGEAIRWAAHGPQERLAAIVALDQFSRSIFRNTPGAFENDPLALKLAKEGIAQREDRMLKPVERWFAYMPLEHSEFDGRPESQRREIRRAPVGGDARDPAAFRFGFRLRQAPRRRNQAVRPFPPPQRDPWTPIDRRRAGLSQEAGIAVLGILVFARRPTGGEFANVCRSTRPRRPYG